MFALACRRVRTLYACLGENDGELSFEPNQIITNGKIIIFSYLVYHRFVPIILIPYFPLVQFDPHWSQDGLKGPLMARVVLFLRTTSRCFLDLCSALDWDEVLNLGHCLGFAQGLDRQARAQVAPHLRWQPNAAQAVQAVALAGLQQLALVLGRVPLDGVEAEMLPLEAQELITKSVLVLQRQRRRLMLPLPIAPLVRQVLLLTLVVVSAGQCLTRVPPK